MSLSKRVIDEFQGSSNFGTSPIRVDGPERAAATESALLRRDNEPGGIFGWRSDTENERFERVFDVFQR
jgi:hypothetical protein